MPPIFTLRITLLGLVSWLVPFVLSFLFFDRTGQPVAPQPLFKSVMVVVFGGLGTWLMVMAFRKLIPTLRSGLTLGCYWLLINIILDLVILVPVTRMPVLTYVYDIGLRYLLIPVIGAGIGAVASQSRT
jgi:hypothetical protein